MIPHRRRKTHLATTVMLAVLCARVSAAGATPPLRLLTHARQVQELSAAEAAREYPVGIHGVVTYVDAEVGGELFVQDQTAGIFVFIKQSRTHGQLHAGQVVDVHGVSTAGDFSPCITKADIRPVGTGSLPKPLRLPFERLVGGSQDGQWAELSGIVQSGQTKQGRLLLNVVTGGGRFVAILPDYPPSWARYYVDARVRLRGALAPIHNGRRQAVGLRIFVPSGSLSIVEPAPADPFAAPRSSSADVGTYSQAGRPEHRIHVSATVIGVEPGGATYVSDGKIFLELQGDGTCLAEPGEVLDIAGFVGPVGFRPGLLDSTCRRLFERRSIEPVDVTADQPLSLQAAMDPSGYGFEEGMRYNMRLIRIDGTVLQTSHGPAGDLLFLESGRSEFIAVLPRHAGGAGFDFENVSRVRLTGVCLIAYDRYGRPETFRVLLRDSADIVELAHAPWWNPRHTLWVLGIMMVCFAGAVSWVTVLRGQVRRQTLELRDANQALKRLSVEDPLTGIANRRKFDETLTIEFNRARESKTALSMLMVDIDYFKALNDEFGHQRGDQCLVEVVRALESASLRNTDLLARYGGEEFAVILPETGGAGAIAVAERMRLAVLSLDIPLACSPHNRRLSISLGVATMHPDTAALPSSLVAMADRALYQSKERGRNRTASLDGILEPGACPMVSGGGA